MSVAALWVHGLLRALGDPLTVAVVGLDSDDGPVMCALYADAGSWLDDARVYVTARAIPMGGRASCSFGDVAPGEYAVAFFHDTNRNGRMDYGPLGLPREPWGVSRDAPARLRRPQWFAAAFQHPGRPLPMTAR